MTVLSSEMCVRARSELQVETFCVDFNVSKIIDNNLNGLTFMRVLCVDT